MTIVLERANQTAPHRLHNLVRVGGRAWPTGAGSPQMMMVMMTGLGVGGRRKEFLSACLCSTRTSGTACEPVDHPPPAAAHSPHTSLHHHSPLTTGLRIAHYQQPEHPCRSHDHMRRVISSGSGCGCRRLCLLYYVIMVVEGEKKGEARQLAQRGVPAEGVIRLIT